MNADLERRHAALWAATDRANRIASIAAEELVRTEGTPTSCPDEFSIPQCQADEHFRDCVAHLVWDGKAFATETDDGYIVIRFQDLTLWSLAA